MAFEWPLNVGDGGLAADGGHVALVEVVEGFVLAAAIAAEARGNEPADAACCVAAHLHGGLGDTRNLPAIFLHMTCYITTFLLSSQFLISFSPSFKFALVKR